MPNATSLSINDIRTPILQGSVTDTDEAVIFIHGSPGSSEDWRDLAALAGEFSRLLAPDTPGLGSADKPESFLYTVDGYAHHLSELTSRRNTMSFISDN
jgi:pimeloyl-ACP methyl ester carboxylesterase